MGANDSKHFPEEKTFEDQFYSSESIGDCKDESQSCYTMTLKPNGSVFIIAKKKETKANVPIPEYHRQLEGTYSILQEKDLEKLEITLTREIGLGTEKGISNKMAVTGYFYIKIKCFDLDSVPFFSNPYFSKKARDVENSKRLAREKEMEEMMNRNK